MSDFFTPKKPINDFFQKNGEEISYPVGQTVVHQKDGPPYTFLLTDGVVRITCEFPGNLTRTIGYLVPNMTFAQAGIFYSFAGGQLHFVADTPITVRRVKNGMFLEQLGKDIAFANAYVEMLSRNQIGLLNRVAAIGAKGIEAQVAHWLNFMAVYFGRRDGNECEIVVPLTRQAIADMIFATRESVHVAVQDLIRMKIMRINRKRLTIINMDKLERLAQRI